MVQDESKNKTATPSREGDQPLAPVPLFRFTFAVIANASLQLHGDVYGCLFPLFVSVYQDEAEDVDDDGDGDGEEDRDGYEDGERKGDSRLKTRYKT